MNDRNSVVHKRLRISRFVLALMALVALIAIAGCGGGGSSSSSGSTASSESPSESGGTGESEDASSEETTEGSSSFPEMEGPSGSNPASALKGTTIGVITITQASEVFPQEQEAMENAFSVLGWHLKVVDLAGDASKVPADVENLIQSGAKAIVLQSVEPSFVGKQALAAAKSAGVPIVGELTGVSVEASEGVLSAAVEGKVQEPGKEIGEEIIGEFGEGAEIALIIDKLAHTGTGAMEGLEEGLDGKADIVAEHQLNYAKLVPDVTQTVEQWLLQHPNLKAIWCPYDGACVGAGQAVQAAGAETAIYSIDGTPGAFELMREGVNYTSYAQPLTYANWLTSDVLVSVLSDRKVEPTSYLPFIKVNSENVTESGTLPEEEIFGDFEKAFEERWGM